MGTNIFAITLEICSLQVILIHGYGMGNGYSRFSSSFNYYPNYHPQLPPTTTTAVTTTTVPTTTTTLPLTTTTTIPTTTTTTTIKPGCLNAPKTDSAVTIAVDRTTSQYQYFS